MLARPPGPPAPPGRPKTTRPGHSSVGSRPDRRWPRGVRPPAPWGRCTRLVRAWGAVGASCSPKAKRGPAPGFSPLSAGSVEMYVYGRSEYEMLSPVLTCEST